MERSGKLNLLFDRKPFQLSLRTKNKTRATYLQKKIDNILDVGLFPDWDEVVEESLAGTNVFGFLNNIEDEIVNNLSLAPSYRKRCVIILDHFRDFLKDEKIRVFPQIKLSTAAKYRNTRLSMYSNKTGSTISPKTVREELIFLKHRIFERALDEKIITENPFRKALAELRVYRKEIIPFTIDEVQKLIANAPNELHRDFYTVLYFTGSRFSEVANLEWNDIDLSNGLLYIKNRTGFKTKTRRDRTIPLHSKLEKVLRKRRSMINNRYVFPSPLDKTRPIKSMSTRFREIRNSLRIDPGKTFHSFRHAFASHLQAQGVPIEVVQELLGHSDIRMTRHYQKIEPKVLRRAVEKLEIDE